MRFAKFLNEKTFDLDDDVDAIYNLAFNKIIRFLQRGNFDEAEALVNQSKTFQKIPSSNLLSEYAQMAHEKNPVTIYCGVYNTSEYSPHGKYITITLHDQALDLLLNFKDGEGVKNQIGKEYKRFKNEFTETRIKSTIYHELSHGINDTLHNDNIKMELKRRYNYGPQASKEFGHISTSFIELDAQVHAIKQLGRSEQDRGDSVTGEEIMTKLPSLHTIFHTAGGLGKAEYNKYMKRLVKRLNREGLLGRGLQNVPSFDEMEKLLRKV